MLLLGLPYSPWTERARFALDARSIRYQFKRYEPLLGEPALRAKLRRWSGVVSVPVLFPDQGPPIADSVDIAYAANRLGQGPDLFPRGMASLIDPVVRASDEALDAGRALSLLRTLASPEALADFVPPAIRRALGGGAVAIARLGVRRTLSKYGADAESADAHRARLRAALSSLREIVGRAEGPLFGALSFADISGAQALGFVAPPDKGLRLTDAARTVFTDVEIAREFSDLVRWRDAIYELRPAPV